MKSVTVWDEVEEQVMNQIWVQVRDQVWDQVNIQILHKARTKP